VRIDIDEVQIGKRVDDCVTNQLPLLRLIGKLRRLLVTHDNTVPALHDVKRRTNDARILAEQVGFGASGNTG
jgi:hypothetical protein